MNFWQTLTCISKKKITLTKVGRKTMQIGHLTGSKVSQLQHRQQLRFALVIRDNSVSLEDLCVLWRKQRKNWTTCGVSKTSKDGKWASNNSSRRENDSRFGDWIILTRQRQPCFQVILKMVKLLAMASNIAYSPTWSLQDLDDSYGNRRLRNTRIFFLNW